LGIGLRKIVLTHKKQQDAAERLAFGAGLSSPHPASLHPVAIHKFYRFYRFLPWGVACQGQLKLGFRWYFETFEPSLDIQIQNREQWQNGSPSDSNASQIRELRFYRRHIDPILLPMAKKLACFQNWASELTPLSLRIARDNRRRALYQPENNILKTGVPSDNTQHASHLNRCGNTSGASQNA
jgi:hypothetical protein